MPVEFRGAGELLRVLRSLPAEQRAVAVVATDAGTELVRKATVDMLMLQEHPPGTPTPSAPGEPPAMISGRLKASVRADRAHDMGDVVEGRVGPTAVYARVQELGGTVGRGTPLPARPYLEPALAESRERIAEIYRSMWGAAGIGR